jgi:hypothetical protein
VRNNRSTTGGGVFYVVRSEAISRNRPGPVQLVQGSAVYGIEELVGEFVSS